LDDASPERETTISERELRRSDESSGSTEFGKTPQVNIMDDGPSVIDSYDPFEMTEEDNRGRGQEMQEMQERGAMLMLNGRRISRVENQESGGIEMTDDSMELDRVMEDANAAVESAAVRGIDISEVKGG
jgi:hypothetical protein